MTNGELDTIQLEKVEDRAVVAECPWCGVKEITYLYLHPVNDQQPSWACHNCGKPVRIFVGSTTQVTRFTEDQNDGV